MMFNKKEKEFLSKHRNLIEAEDYKALKSELEEDLNFMYRVFLALAWLKGFPLVIEGNRIFPEGRTVLTFRCEKLDFPVYEFMRTKLITCDIDEDLLRKKVFDILVEGKVDKSLAKEIAMSARVNII